jgi:hypothetical protein
MLSIFLGQSFGEKPGQPHLILILQHSATFAMVAELSRRMKGGLINTNGLCGK